MIPLHSEFTAAGFRLYTLDVGLALGLQEEEQGLTLAQVVLTRQDGLLLALPELAISADILALGNQEGTQGLVGPSTRVEVVCAALDEEAIALPPVPVEGRTLTVLLVDFTNDVLPFLKALRDRDLLDSVHAYEMLEPLLVPESSDLVARALAWASSDEAQEIRIQFYSADDVPETPSMPDPKRRSRTKQAGADPGGTGATKAAAKKRPTVHQLAESLELITRTLPTITEQLQDLTIRTEAMEKGIQTQGSRPSALRVPLGSLAMSGSAKPSSPASLVKAMPPPRNTSGQPSTRVTFSQKEAEELEEDLPVQSGDLARAMLEQSKAITALVSQIAGNSADPLSDLGSASSSLSSKGALGRQRLQAELAAHRGTFFTSVLQSMSRRMRPAMSADVGMGDLRDRGVTPTQYLERFGGFGRTKDVGMIIWQVAMIMNHLQEDNVQAAKDAISLLFVCLEQTALDGGSMQVGLLLSLTEDPPASLFSARSIATASQPRPFAPTANQRWVTTALQFLKEMDVIATRRQDIIGGKSQASKADPEPLAKATPKKKAKGRGKGKSQQEALNAEEET